MSHHKITQDAAFGELVNILKTVLVYYREEDLRLVSERTLSLSNVVREEIKSMSTQSSDNRPIHEHRGSEPSSANDKIWIAELPNDLKDKLTNWRYFSNLYQSSLFRFSEDVR